MSLVDGRVGGWLVGRLVGGVFVRPRTLYTKCMRPTTDRSRLVWPKFVYNNNQSALDHAYISREASLRRVPAHTRCCAANRSYCLCTV